MPVSLTSLKVLPHFEIGAPGGFDVFWTISGQDFTPTFQVHVSDLPDGTFVPLLETKTSDFHLLNASTPKQNMQEALQTWFKVEVFNGSVSKLLSPPMDCRAGMQRARYLQYREMLRRWRLFFAKTACLDGWLVRRKFYGTRCPQCTNQILATSPGSNECPLCFGTTIVGGFYAPFATKSDWSPQVSPRTANTSKEPSGPQQVQRLKIKIPAYPDAHSEDLWLDAGTRVYYLIESVDPEMWCGSTVTQTATISRLPAHHQVYKLPSPS